MPHNLPINFPAAPDSIFTKIWLAAKAKDVRTLTTMVDADIALDIFIFAPNFLVKNYCPIMWLAWEGNVESVNFLISKFRANRNFAIQGYALANNIEQVNLQIKQGADPTHAVTYYACAGNEQQVNLLLAAGANPHHAVIGYAMGGDVKQVNVMLAQNEQYLDAALRGYSRGGHIEQVNLLLAQGAKPHSAAFGYAVVNNIEQVNLMLAQGADPHYAAMGYARTGNVIQASLLTQHPVVLEEYALVGNMEQVKLLLAKGASLDHAITGFAYAGNVVQVNRQIAQGADRNKAVEGYITGNCLNPITVLNLMSYTDDPVLRRMLATEVKKQNPNLDVIALQVKSTKLNKLMRKYQVDYEQAEFIVEMNPLKYTWILQAIPHFLKHDILPPEIILSITAYIFECNADLELRKTMAAANKNLFTHSIEHSANFFKLGLFSMEKYLTEHTEAVTRFNNRHLA